MNCPKCHSKFLRIGGYRNRKRITIGEFCPICLVFHHLTEEFHKERDNIIKENKQKLNSKPKFIRKQRMECPYCYNDKENPRVNRSKWTIRKLPKKKDETQHWKCTCQLCGNVWTTNSGNEYYYYPEGYKEYEKMSI